MNKFMTYNNCEIEILRHTSSPAILIYDACSITQKKEFKHHETQELKVNKLIKYLLTANHTSPLEHAFITVLIKNVSRSFLAQITRHRIGASPTSASQHYITYNEFPNVLSEQMINTDGIEYVLDNLDEYYNDLIAQGIPKEEARQVLPNAKAVNIMWTVNARSLINFFNQRLCKRNVEEMVNFAEKLYKICCNWFPELFKYVGPDCIMLGGCRQSHMKAQVCIDNDIPNFSK